MLRLFNVNFFVARQQCRSGERFRTDDALEGFFTTMNESMFGEIVFAEEQFVANIARKFTFSGMVRDVNVQQLFQWKTTFTVWAWKHICFDWIGNFQRILFIFQNYRHNFDVALFVGANDRLAKLWLNVVSRILVENFRIFVQNLRCWRWQFWHWCFNNFDFFITSFTFHNNNVLRIDGAGCIRLRRSIQEFNCRL